MWPYIICKNKNINEQTLSLSLCAMLYCSCLTTAPHWKKTTVVAGGGGGGVAGSSGSARRPLSHVNSGGGGVGHTAGVKEGATPSPMDDCTCV